jgi:hypothetical protein
MTAPLLQWVGRKSLSLRPPLKGFMPPLRDTLVSMRLSYLSAAESQRWVKLSL